MRRRPGRFAAVGRTIALLIVLLAPVLGGSVLAAAPAGALGREPTRADIAYGTDPQQLLDVYLPVGAPIGTIIYFHGGGWNTRSKTDVVPMVKLEVDRGWALVSVGYRLAPGAHAQQILGDVDQAIRFIRAEADALGVDGRTLIVAGSSAGGYLAVMAGVAPGAHRSPTLPANLRTVSPVVSGVATFSGPTDMRSLYASGAYARSISSSFLGCAASPTAPVGRCGRWYLDDLTAQVWAERAIAAGRRLPPIYMEYGGADPIVLAGVHGEPLRALWTKAAVKPTSVVYDYSPTRGHDNGTGVNPAVFNLWCRRVRFGGF
jgi:acetyl esterase/lipase